MSNKYNYKHIVVVHGIGNQAPNETALGFMNEFIRALPRGKEWNLSVENLIESVDSLAATDVPKEQHPRSFQPANIVFSDFTDPENASVNVIGFSEVYWQPIARWYIKNNCGNLPIPIFTWARSISTRLLGPGYEMAQWRAVIENLETMLKLLGRLAMISKRNPEFAKVTTDFLGDVEMYAESDQIRQEINQKFFEVMSRVGDFAESSKNSILARLKSADPLVRGFEEFQKFEDIQIYVVAHSEGTVVAYNSLVQAAMVKEGAGDHPGDKEFERANTACAAAYSIAAERRGGVDSMQFDWLPKVAGLFTLGSPLDKHYVIWRSRFRRDRLKRGRNSKIPWFNFYDYNDPVAYAIEVLQKPEKDGQVADAQKMFDIGGKDLGFQRYPIPGKAHIDYWTDTAIHHRIIYDGMKLATGQAESLAKRWWAPLQPLFMWFGYVVGRAATILVGLFFINRLLYMFSPGPLLSWPVLKRAHDMISSLPLGSNAQWFNYLIWVAVPLVVMKFLFEAEQGLVKNRELSPGVRWILIAAWFADVLIICLYHTPKMGGGGITDLLGYAVGLFATVLVWRLHTTVHRGLIQLWRKTKVL